MLRAPTRLVAVLALGCALAAAAPAAARAEPAAAAGSAAAGEALLAIDVGGQGIKYKLYGVDGAPLSRAARVATPPRATPAQIEALVVGIHGRAVARLAGKRALAGVVVGFPGSVERGRVLGAPNLDAGAWRNGGRGVDLEAGLTRRLGAPVLVENDLAVAAHGLTPASGRALLVGLGTGLGAIVGSRDRAGRLALASPWQDHEAGMFELERLVGEAGRRATTDDRWASRLLERALPQLRAWTAPDRVRIFGGNAERLRADPAARARLRAAGVELVSQPRFANLRGAVPYWKATATARRARARRPPGGRAARPRR